MHTIDRFRIYCQSLGLNVATLSESSHSFFIVVSAEDVTGRIRGAFTQERKQGPLTSLRLAKADCNNIAVVGAFRF